MIVTKTKCEKAGETQIFSLKLNSVSKHFQNFVVYKNGGLWIGDIGKIHYLQDGKITEYGEKEGFPTNTRAHDFWEETDGNIWFATGDGNLSVIGSMKFKDGKFSKFGLENGLSNDRILCLQRS